MWKLNSQLKAMSIVAGILILIGGTVVGIYHCSKMLGWIAIFPAAGFLFADYLGFHLIFFARQEKGLLGWGSLVCKFIIFGTLLLNGASLVFLLITNEKDKAAVQSRIEAKKAEAQIETDAKLKVIQAQSNARQSEGAKRAENAAKLKAAGVSTKLAITAIAEKPAPVSFDTAPAPSPSASPAIATEAQAEAPGIVERFARWYTRAPLYFSGGLVGLCCFVLIQIFGKLSENRDARQSVQPSIAPAQSAQSGHFYTEGSDGQMVYVGEMSEGEARRRMMVDQIRERAESRLANEQPQVIPHPPKPRIVWQGGKIVDPKDNKRSH